MTDFHYLALMAGWEFLFGAVVVVLLLLRISRWIRFLLAIPFLLMALLMAGIMLLAVWTQFTPPLHVWAVPELAKCAEQKDRAAVLTALKTHGFSAEIHEKPLSQKRAEGFGIPVSESEASASHVSLMPFRFLFARGTVHAEYLCVEYLFDSHQQLVTWTYYWAYYP